jgi:hypothetical protein
MDAVDISLSLLIAAAFVFLGFGMGAAHEGTAIKEGWCEANSAKIESSLCVHDNGVDKVVIPFPDWM